MQRVENIIKKSSQEIKQILLQEARKFDKFPETMIGINDSKYATNPEIVDGLFGKVSMSSDGIALPKPGILVYDAKEFWMQNHYIIMLPDGLYRFNASSFLETSNGKSTDYVKPFPNWQSKFEEPMNYLIYGKDTLSRMKELLKNKR